MTTATDLVERVTRDFRAIHSAAEEILFNLGPEEPVTSDQADILRQAGIEGRDAIDRERARVACVKRWMAQSGTNAELAEAERELLAAVRADEAQRPDLEQRLAALQAELKELARARASAADRVQRFSAARENLREPRLLPAFVRDADQVDRGGVKTRLGKAIADLEAELNFINGLEQMESGSKEARTYAQQHAPLLLSADGQNVDSVAWDVHVRTHVGKRPAIAEQLGELNEERDAQLAKASRRRDFYIEKLS